MSASKTFVRWFDELSIADVGIVGGKNASLGEMYQHLTKKGIVVPNGFAITADAYYYLLEKCGIKDHIKKILKGLNVKKVEDLEVRGNKIRTLIKNAEFPPELTRAILKGYTTLCKQYAENCDVAVRSSATAEDLPDASFAGQQETYLNIHSEHDLLDACKRCFASLFTNRAISYREEKGFDHLKIGLSIGVQKMVRSDKACSGVLFTIDTESGFKDVVFITAAYGLGENIVQGAVNPDEYYVFKPTLKHGYDAIISKTVGSKNFKMVYGQNGNKPTKNIPVSDADRKKFVLTNDEILTLAKWGCAIEEHYSQKAGYFKPMDIEWAKDGISNKLFIVQARPETVHSREDKATLKEYVLQQKSNALVKGLAVGNKIGQGKVNLIKNVQDVARFTKGDVLVTEMTDPDWVVIMKQASAIVTNRGGRTCFPAGTKILTNKGFMNIEDIHEGYEGLFVPSLNRETLKIEWKPIIATMKRDASVIEIETSLTGRMRGNTLRLTPDHKMITFNDAELHDKEIQEIVRQQEMIVCAQKIPSLNTTTEKERQLAYLLGAISTDGNIYTTRTHGEVQLIQKETEEKKEFIASVNACLKATYNKEFKKFEKKTSTGEIRGKPAHGNANAYRCYSKGIAYAMLEEKEELTETLLSADESFIYSFLAGVIDGDGSFNKQAQRINIYCSKEPLLQAIMVGCLRLGIAPQVTVNRTIWNVQIVEKLDMIFRYTKRVKGIFSRKRIGTRFFSAKQLFGQCSTTDKLWTSVKKNLLRDAEKIQQLRLSPECRQKVEKILASDTRMQRVALSKVCEVEEVYNISVADNHNYIVFSDRYTPILVNNCHAAIVARELGLPCIVGSGNATEVLKHGQPVTVDCSKGEEGIVWQGIIKYTVKETNIKELPKPKTKIMMNVGNPDQAFDFSFLPNDGVGLARMEFIINNYIKVHPKALLYFTQIKDAVVRKQIEDATLGYTDKKKFFIDKLAEGIGRIAAAFYPKPVILRFSDFKTNEYANLIGGKAYEPIEANPMIGWRGAARYYSPDYRDAFALECLAVKKVREEFGLHNVEVMIPMCRTPEEGQRVLLEMKKNGLDKEKGGLKVMCMCEVPSNVILANKFLEIFDGFSIGSNDLTQLTLAVDRDSQLVSHIYNERNEAVKLLIKHVIEIANAKGKYNGICGDAPSTFEDFAQFLIECGIQSISLSPDAVIRTTLKIAEFEKKLGK